MNFLFAYFFSDRPQEIDEAARRRMVKRLYIPLPEGEARKQIICNLLKDQHYSLSEEDFEKLKEKSEGTTDRRS
jgi:SpoVK/Ycf46/Vps4 family AAA+-type ATPase